MTAWLKIGRSLTDHAVEQSLRFVRLFAAALAVQLPVSGSWDRRVIIAAVVAALETAFRQWKRTAPVAEKPLP